jgi:hypothetical protein
VAWVCPNCGTKNEAGLFNFCKKCGSTPPRDPSGHAGSPTAQAGDKSRAQQERRAQPQIVTSSSQQRTSTVKLSSGSRRRRGGGGFIGVVVFVAIAAGLVLAVASRVDVGETIRDLTSADSVATEGTLGVDDLLETSVSGAISAPPDEVTGEPVTAPGETDAPPTSSVAGPAVDPELDVASATDRRCANRWNGRQNARARRAVVAALEDGRPFAGVQLAVPESTGWPGDGPDARGQCLVIFGVQTDRSTTRIAPGDVYIEAGPITGPRLPFVRLPAVSLRFAWNARVAKDGRIVAVRAQPTR